MKRIGFAVFLMFAVIFITQANAKNNSGDTVQVDRNACEVAGGTYSEGSNYSRCEYDNGDSYTCNTDVNQCETCTGGKCTVQLTGGAQPLVPGKPLKVSPSTQPAGGKAALQPVKMRKITDKSSPQ